MKFQILRLRRPKNYLLVVGVCMPYIFLLAGGSFLVDDWGQLANGRTYIAHVKEWEALWAYRPVSWVLIPALLHIFKDSFLLVSFFHFSLYFFAIYQIVVWRKLKFGESQRKLAVILLAAPVFSSTFLLSPVNQLSASFSLFFFALGLFFEKRFISNKWSGIVTYSCFIFSVLSYEISIPLILVHYLFLNMESPKSFLKFLSLPSLLVLLIFWQKIVAAEFFDSDFSRLNSFSFLPLLSFVVSVLVSAPLYLIEGLIRNTILVIVSSFIIYYLLHPMSRESSKVTKDRTVTFTLLIGFVSNGALFLLSGRYSLVDGYQNRGLMSSWILFSLIVARLLVKGRFWVPLFIVVFAAVNFSLFTEKLIESAQAGDARQRVITEIVKSRELAKNSLPTIVLSLPCVFPNADFRNEIFCTSWDARGALAHNGLDLPTVLVLGDDPLIAVKELAVEDGVNVVYFDSEFSINRIEPLTFESQRDLIALVEKNYLKSQARIASCESNLSSLVRLKASGSFREYLNCAKHPLSGS